jgi:hypothetical protein
VDALNKSKLVNGFTFVVFRLALQKYVWLYSLGCKTKNDFLARDGGQVYQGFPFLEDTNENRPSVENVSSASFSFE